MSSFRSAAADTPEKPMSEVEPSPPQTTTVVSPRPRSRNAALSAGRLRRRRRERRQVDGDAERVDGVDTGDDRPARRRDHEDDLRLGCAAASPPSTCRMLIAGPQPAQALWPGRRSFSSDTISSSQAAIATPPPERRPGRGSPAHADPRLAQGPAQRVRSHVDAAQPADEVPRGLHVRRARAT